MELTKLAVAAISENAFKIGKKIWYEGTIFWIIPELC